MPDLCIEYIDISKLIAFPGNSRSHPDKQISQVAKSIDSFGFINPIVIDGNSEIIAGHARLEAALKLDLDRVPTVKVEHLSEAQVRLYRIADNKLAENATWDEHALRLELQYLDTIDIDVELSGFEMPEIDIILSNSDCGVDTEAEDLKPPEKPIVKLGDVFSLGRHRLICGDCRSPEIIVSLMGGAEAKLTVTDPPYNVAINGHVLVGTTSHNEFAMASGEMSSSEFSAFLTQSFKHFYQYSADGSLHLIFMDWRHIREILQAGDKIYDDLINLCVWAKTNAGMGSLWRSQHELVFAFKKGKAPHTNNVQLGKFGRHRSNLWTYAGMNTFGSERDAALSSHPTVKPTQMIADAILDVSNRGDIVLDGFLGSGTTLLAAEETGRVCYGCEIDPGYAQLAIDRFRKVSDEPIIHQLSGKKFEELREMQRSGTGGGQANE